MTLATNRPTFSLSNFEGPLDLLLYLIQKSELDIYDIPIATITEQYLEAIKDLETQDVDQGAEFLSTAMTLLYIKSRTLLPRSSNGEEEIDEEADPRFEIIHQLMEYCHYKQSGKQLSKIEEEQRTFFYRGVDPTPPDPQKPLGLKDLSLADLEVVFRDCMQRAAAKQGDAIEEEEWRVADKMRLIKHYLKSEDSIPLIDLFERSKSKLELIVIFLAVLELLKIGQAALEKEDNGQVFVIKSNRE